MFILQPKPTFEADVTIPTMTGDATITVTFNHMGRKALRAFFDGLTAEGNTRTDADALQDLVSGWSGVDTPFSAEALETLIDNYPASARVIYEAYNKALFEGQQKNSKT